MRRTEYSGKCLSPVLPQSNVQKGGVFSEAYCNCVKALHSQFCHLSTHCTLGAVAFSFSHFGGGTGGIFLDQLHCYGYESRLLNCTHPAIGLHDCNHNADAGVRCQGET